MSPFTISCGAAAALASAALIGCQADAAVPQSTGFVYVCSGALSDAACNEAPGTQPATMGESPLPERLAVGADVRFAFWPSTRGAGGPLAVANESRDVLRAVHALALPAGSGAADRASSFVVSKPGSVSLAAFAASGEVVGRARLEAFAVDHIGFDRFADTHDQPIAQQSIPSATLERVGAHAILRAVPMNASGEVLAGTLHCSWSSASPGVVDVEGPANGNFVNVIATGAGAGTLHVEIGGASADLPITVER